MSFVSCWIFFCFCHTQPIEIVHAKRMAERKIWLCAHRVKARSLIVSIKVFEIIGGSFAIRRFPTFCGALVGGYTFLQYPLRTLYAYIYLTIVRKDQRSGQFYNARYPASRFVAALISAWLSLPLLNTFIISRGEKPTPEDKSTNTQQSRAGIFDGAEDKGVIEATKTSPQMPSTDSAGRTIDLTILAVARAVDTIVINLWRQSNSSTLTSRRMSPISTAISRYTDTLVFALSSGTIMWAWFYLPDKLPRAYNKWIGQAAQVDPRLVELLRESRTGKMIYGKDTGLSPILQSMCKTYQWPLDWGDPAKTVPIPCEVVHMGIGPSCHWHAAVRFARAFKFAMATYLPLQILIKVRKPSLQALRRACEEAVRSSAFLGAFVGLFYYGVCLARTRLGPKLFSRETITPIMWDSGLCVRAGCILCGWSILIEAEKRRQELAMFVAPRALATLLPREYDAKVSLFWVGSWGLDANLNVVSLERKGGLFGQYSRAVHAGSRRSKQSQGSFGADIASSVTIALLR